MDGWVSSSKLRSTHHYRMPWMSNCCSGGDSNSYSNCCSMTQTQSLKILIGCNQYFLNIWGGRGQNVELWRKGPQEQFRWGIPSAVPHLNNGGWSLIEKKTMRWLVDCMFVCRENGIFRGLRTPSWKPNGLKQVRNEEHTLTAVMNNQNKIVRRDGIRLVRWY